MTEPPYVLCLNCENEWIQLAASCLLLVVYKRMQQPPNNTQQQATGYAKERNMSHLTMLGIVGQQFCVRLHEL